MPAASDTPSILMAGRAEPTPRAWSSIPGVLNPDLLKGKKGGRISRVTVKDRADAIIAHEYEELRRGLARRGLEGGGEDGVADQRRERNVYVGRWRGNQPASFDSG